MGFFNMAKGGKGLFDKFGADGLKNAGAYGGPNFYMPPEAMAQFGAPGIGDGIPGNAPAATIGRMPPPLPVKVPRPGDGRPGGRQRGGFSIRRMLDNIGGAEGLSMALMQSQALLAGDTATAARIAISMQEARQQREQGRAEAATRQSMFNNMVKQGMDPADAELAMSNPEAFGTNFNERFGSSDLSEGESRFTPAFGRGQAPQITTMPKTYEQGADIVSVNPQTGDSNMIYQGMVAAQQEARALGLQPGTPQYETFVRDSVLGAQGPTGTATARRGQDISRANTMTRESGAMTRHNTPGAARPRAPNAPTPTTVVGQIMAKQAAGQPLTPQEQQVLQQYQQGRGRAAGRAGGNSARIVNPQTGRAAILRGGRWVDEQTGQPVQ